MIHMIVLKPQVEIVSLILESWPTLAASTSDPGITWSVQRSVPQKIFCAEFMHDLYCIRHRMSDRDDPNGEVIRIFS